MYNDEIMDKVETRAGEVLDELGKLKVTDPEYGKAIGNLSALVSLKADQEVRDQNKYDSNYKNELEDNKDTLVNSYASPVLYGLSVYSHHKAKKRYGSHGNIVGIPEYYAHKCIIIKKGESADSEHK